MSAKLLPFAERDGGLLRRFRAWRAEFAPARHAVNPGRVVAIEVLRWRRYGKWRRRMMLLKHESSPPTDCLG